MSRHSKGPLCLILALALLGTGVLFSPQRGEAMGSRRDRPRPIVHGERPFEIPYTHAVIPGAWRPLQTGIEDDLVAITAIDDRHAWVTGASGGIYRTSDGGDTWKPLIGIDAERYQQIVWTGPKRAIALTHEGEVLRSMDGGASWRPLPVRAPRGVRRIAFVDAEQGWMIGDRGLILHTRDGGRSWDRQTLNARNNLTVIQMISAKTGWVGGEGHLFGTRDGGRRWRSLEFVPIWSFVSGRRGFATDGEAIYKTEERGEAWKRIWTIPDHLETGKRYKETRYWARSGENGAPRRGGRQGHSIIAGVQFVDRYNGVAEVLTGDRQVLFRTRSLGRVWKHVYEARRGSQAELSAVFMVDGRYGWAIDGAGNLRGTSDGARTWPIQVASEYFDLTDVGFADPQNGWAVGRGGHVLVTEDGGRNWRKGARQLKVAFNRVRAGRAPSGDTRAWAAGADGTLAASSREGRLWRRSWRKQPTLVRDEIRGLDFAGLRSGIAVGDGGMVIATTDGGVNWVRRDAGVKLPFLAVALAGPRRVLLAGASVLLGSVDGGLTFKREPVERKRRTGTFVDVAAPDPLHLFALQKEGSLLRSIDGGERWERLEISDTCSFRRLKFADADYGWALGEQQVGGSVIYITTDGGESWKERDLPTTNAKGLDFVGRSDGWVVGPQTILVSRDGGLNWQRQSVGTSKVIRAFAFPKKAGGWAVGDSGFVARYPPLASEAAKGE